VKFIYQDRTKTVDISTALDTAKSLVDAKPNLVYGELLGMKADAVSEEDAIAKVAYFLGLVYKGEDKDKALKETKDITKKVDEYRKLKGK